MEKLRELIKKHWDIVSYLFFGVLTTAVSYLVYFPLYNLLDLPATVSNALSWIAAVAFAYVTNKPFVFKSHDWSRKTVIPELLKFIGCRIGSGLAETILLLITVDLLHINGNVMKLVASVVVVILNYIGSKLLVFNKA